MMYSFLEQLTYRPGWLRPISQLTPGVLARPEINFLANSESPLKWTEIIRILGI